MKTGSLTAGHTRLCRHATGRLFLGTDHLLVVVSSGFVERYLWVALRDVRGVFLVRSDRRLHFFLGLGLVAVIDLITLLARANTTGKPPRLSLLILAVTAVAAAVNHFRGEGVVSHLVTDVQTLKLPGFRRLPQGRRVVARLEAALREGQTPAVLS